jgi:hypothetical protein
MRLQLEVSEMGLLIPPSCLYIRPRVHVVFRSFFFIALLAKIRLLYVPAYGKTYMLFCMHLESTSLNSEQDYKRLEFVSKAIN